jgi:hypothetical protein
MTARRRRRPRVFLSYRREDASGHAGRLYDALSERFGDENVFMDVDTIQVGTDFADAITRAVASCDALIALIGRDWATAADETGRRRIDDPGDFVRLELETALERGVSVLPVCVRGASFPDEEGLPAPLAALARRQGAELRDTAWRDDVRRLIERIESLVRPQEPHRRAWWRSRRALLAGGAAAATAIAVVVAVALLRGGPGTPSGAFPNADERQLLSSVPAITRTNCERIDYGDEAAKAAVECSGGAGTAVTYNLFENTQVRDSWYERTREEAGIEPDGGSCSPETFAGETRYGDGRYVCWFEGSEPVLAWTHGATGVGARANSWQRQGAAGAQTLFRQWQCCLRPQPPE